MSSRKLQLSAPIADETTTTTCYMCACRCGIRVHLKNGVIRYIEGNPDHPVNRGVLCAKGSAGIMQHYSPARLTKPLRRKGPRGSGEFEEIEWDQALSIATDWLGGIRQDDPKKLAFFTGRDQSQALTSWWAQQFGTPNYAAHGGFCSVNMAAAGMYSIGSSFWEFSEPDWERTRYFMLFGVAEDHSSNPIKIGLSRLKARGAKTVSVNPVRTGYSAIADEWIGITPGTDGLFVLALAHELLRTGRVDVDYLARYTNAGVLVIDDPGGAEHGLFYRDADGQTVCRDRVSGAFGPAHGFAARPALKGEFTLPDGRRAKPVFHLLAERCLDTEYSPDAVAATTGIPAERTRSIAAELARAAFDDETSLDIPWTDAWGRRHEKTVARPVSMHAMRGISAHANGFQTCRAIHVLQMLLGSIDAPGGLLHKPPYPKSLDCLPRPCGAAAEPAAVPLAGAHLGYPCSPEDLLVDEAGNALRIDKAFSWEAPLAAHGMMHSVISNAWAADPYPIDTLFLYMANMAWNSAMNTAESMRMLTDKDPRSGEYRIPRIIYSDAYYSETVAYADLVLPDTTYLERWDAISLLDRPISDADAVADSIRQPVLEPDRDVRAFQDVLLDLGARLKLPGMTDDEGNARFPGGYADYIVNHERRPGIGTLAGWRGSNGTRSGSGEVNPEQLQRYAENNCYWRQKLAPDCRYYRHANQSYLEFAREMRFRDGEEPIVLSLYAEPLQRFRLAGEGHGEVIPPRAQRERIRHYFDPLPFWYAAIAETNDGDYPFHALTQRPMAMYHSWGSHNAWLRQIHGDNKLYIAASAAESLGLEDDDWVWIRSANAEMKVPVKIMAGLNPHTVWTWNAIGKRKGAWNLSPAAPESNRGFLLNHLIADRLPGPQGSAGHSNSDPITGQAAWYDLRVGLRKIAEHEARTIEPVFERIRAPAGLPKPPDVSRYGARKR